MDQRHAKSAWELIMGSLTPMSGAIVIGTPKLSTWIKLVGLESFTATLATTGTVNGIWTAQGSNDDSTVKAPDSIVDLSGYPSQPAYPTGVASSGDVVQPTYGFRYIRLSLLASAGAGNATVTFKGQFTGAPLDMAQNHHGSIHIIAPAADTLAGQFALEGSNDWSGIFAGSRAKGRATADGNWTPYLPSPAIAAKVASTIQDRLIDLGVTTDGATGVIRTGAIRLNFTWTAGFGSPNAYGVFKSA